MLPAPKKVTNQLSSISGALRSSSAKINMIPLAESDEDLDDQV